MTASPPQQAPQSLAAPRSRVAMGDRSSRRTGILPELGLQGGIDGLDELAQGLEQRAGAAVAFTTVGGADELDAVLVQEMLELFGDVALVGEDPLARAQQNGLGLEEVPGHLALVDLGVGQRKGDRQPSRGAHQMESQPQNQREWLAQQP